MKRPLSLLLAALVAATTLFADEPTRALQSELKTQGFYYGEIDGTAGPALSAALKRYQIRNGLEVTGTASPETLSALNLGGGGSAPAREPSPAEPVAPAERQPEPPAPPKPHVDLRKKQALVESDQRALDETRPTPRVQRDPSIVPAPVDPYRPPSPQSNPRYLDLYAGSPFASAPPQLQEQTLRAAQRMLAAEGFYRAPADGQPGPATVDAIVLYQRSRNIPRTGRLDFETLSAFRLMPGPGSVNPVLKPFTAPPRQPRTYRGIWVD